MKIRNWIDIGLVLLVIVGGWLYNFEIKKRQEVVNKIGQKEALAKDLQAKIVFQGNTITELQRDKNELVVWKKKFVPVEGSVTGTIKENENLKKVVIPSLIEDNNKLKSQMSILLEKIKNAKTPEELSILQKESVELQGKLNDNDKRLKDALDKLQYIDFEYKTIGFTTRLGGGIYYDDTIKYQLDVKWFYMNRISVVSGIGFDSIDIKNSELMTAITYHVNGFSPEWLQINNLEIEAGVAYQLSSQKLKLLVGIRSNF